MSKPDTPKRPPTRATRRGNGAGYGGPAKGAGSAKPKADFGPQTNAQGHNATTPETRAALRREQSEALKDMLYTLAETAESEMARIQAANSFIDRVEGKAVARSEVRLTRAPDEMSDAELAAEIEAERLRLERADTRH